VRSAGEKRVGHEGIEKKVPRHMGEHGLVANCPDIDIKTGGVCIETVKSALGGHPETIGHSQLALANASCRREPQLPLAATAGVDTVPGTDSPSFRSYEELCKHTIARDGV